MGILDRLFGTQTPARAAQPSRGSADELAIERYRYLLRTAPPDAIEQAHQEAFAQLSPEQRAQVLTELTRDASPSERANAQPEPNALARLATRAELRQPGTLERALGGAPGVGVGGSFAGTLLSSIAGTFIGTAIAHQFLGGFGDHDAQGLHGRADDAQDANDHDKADHDQDLDQYASHDDFEGDALGVDDFDV